jgi:hypothetical protein
MSFLEMLGVAAAVVVAYALLFGFAVWVLLV